MGSAGSEEGAAPAERVVRLAASGEGVAADGRRRLYVLPGERVRAAHGGKPTLLETSPDRVDAACRHFGTCGGCLLQHASDPFLIGWKTDIVRRALAARLLEALFRTPHQSPPGARRRAVFAGRRTRKGAIVGFRAYRSHEIVPVLECPVVRPEIAALLPVLSLLTLAGASRSGVLRLAVAWSDTGADIAVSDGKPLDVSLLPKLAEIADRHDLARLAWNGEVVAARRPPWQTVGRARVVPPPGAFMQATADAADAMAETVLEAIAPASRVADLFAGSGTFTLRIAEVAEVHAVEAESDAVAALDASWRQSQGLKRVTTEVRDLFGRPLLPHELAPFEAVAVDPPRAGAEAQMRAVAASRVGRVACISCDPVTFARDAEILVRGGFRLLWLRVFDQFRWSPHTELVAAFERR